MKKIILMILLVLLAMNIFAADKTINDLSAIGSGNIVDGDKFHIFDISASVGTREKNSLASTLRAYIFGSGFSLGGKLTGAAYEIEGSNFDINGGTIDGATIGASTTSTGKFTNLEASGTFSSGLYAYFGTNIDCAGKIGVYNRIDHIFDTDTYIDLGGSSTDQIDIHCGGVEMVSFNETTQDIVNINPNTLDIDFRIESDIDSYAFFLRASDSKIGIGNSSPKTKVDIHHNPTDLANNTGGGDVITFGIEDGTEVLTAGKIYYLSIGGIWKYADASAGSTAKSGDVLLGVALGASISNGILLNGYYRADTYVSSFQKGKTVYVSDTTPGSVTTVKPAGATEVIRPIGWCTDTADVIYFQPSGYYEIN